MELAQERNLNEIRSQAKIPGRTLESRLLLSSIDVLLVINYLNSDSEGESSQDSLSQLTYSDQVFQELLRKRKHLDASPR